MKTKPYRTTWLDKSWSRKNGFKGKTKKHSVDYDRERDARLVKLNGEFSREHLMTIVFEMEINYAIAGVFTNEANKKFLKGTLWEEQNIQKVREKLKKENNESTLRIRRR